MNKWLSRIGESNLKNHQLSGDNVDNARINSTPSTMSPDMSRNIEKKSYLKICKEEELRLLIKKISLNYGSDDEQFLDDYISDVINEWSNDLDAALACFRDISVQRIK